MQTFLPYPGFRESAAVLDRQRLGKQRVEVMQILNALMNDEGGWLNHPAVKMWRGYEPALFEYGLAIADEWVKRGYKHHMTFPVPLGAPVNPPWIGRESFHASHRSNLLRKNPEHYSRFGWTEGPDLPYEWPIMKYTRSPWIIEPYSTHDKEIHLLEPGITVDNDDRDHEEAGGNAILASRAPDMYELLKKMSTWSEEARALVQEIEA